MTGYEDGRLEGLEEDFDHGLGEWDEDRRLESLKESFSTRKEWLMKISGEIEYFKIWWHIRWSLYW